VAYHDFTCPECGASSRFEDTESLQRCSSCGAFHQSVVLLEDNFAEAKKEIRLKGIIARNRVKREFLRRLRKVRRPATLSVLRGGAR
jgi:hypothetical protein